MMLVHGGPRAFANERRSRMLHSAQQEVNRTLAGSPDFVGGCRRILAALGDNLDWSLGELWNVTPDALARRLVWHRPDPQLARFAESWTPLDHDTLPTIPREIIAHAAAARHPDISVDDRFTRSDLARVCGLHAAFGFPLQLGARTLGAMVFFSRKVVSPDDELLRFFAGIGSQVTEFLVRHQAEASLRASEEHFRQLVDGVRDYALYMIDSAGRVASWNIGAETIKGYSATEIVGHEVSLLYTEDDIARGVPQRELELAQRNGRHAYEGWRRRKNGSLFWASALITPLWHQDGSLRDVMANLRPPALDDYGLLPALRWYGERFGQRTGIEVEFVADESFPRLPRAAENGLFRIAQEALTNLVKHSGAPRAIIEVRQNDQQASLLIRDEGHGFQQTAASVAEDHRHLSRPTDAETRRVRFSSADQIRDQPWAYPAHLKTPRFARFKWLSRYPYNDCRHLPTSFGTEPR